jgi:hypothetical protein
LNGTVKITSSAIGTTQKWTDPFELDLPVGMDGESHMVVEFELNGKKYLGTGQLQLSNGMLCLCTVKGSYYAKKDEYRLTLSFYDPVKFSLKLYVEEGAGDLHMLSGTVLGQKLKRVAE